jgi:hypothetical protein
MLVRGGWLRLARVFWDCIIGMAVERYIVIFCTRFRISLLFFVVRSFVSMSWREGGALYLASWSCR